GERLLNFNAAGDHRAAEGYRRELSRAAKRKLVKAPANAHSLRQLAIYVDLSDTGRWQRPCHLPVATAAEFVNEVCGDYSLHLDQIEHDDSDAFQALRAWRDRPAFPKAGFADSPGVPSSGLLGRPTKCSTGPLIAARFATLAALGSG
ncbi:MAG: hypothetical protein ACRD2L_25295, partial [Terriglobia bacterium]